MRRFFIFLLNHLKVPIKLITTTLIINKLVIKIICFTIKEAAANVFFEESLVPEIENRVEIAKLNEERHNETARSKGNAYYPLSLTQTLQSAFKDKTPILNHNNLNTQLNNKNKQKHHIVLHFFKNVNRVIKHS